ncbi:hypothetical protein BDZ88DRAFT_192001 [Geranomyces variabilis]|nr:hypothetical protein BDZ88DRAFT_192001 [Geranomyces variabilis]
MSLSQQQQQQDAHAQLYHCGQINESHQSSFWHQVISDTVGLEAMKAYEKTCADTGQLQSHKITRSCSPALPPWKSTGSSGPRLLTDSTRSIPTRSPSRTSPSDSPNTLCVMVAPASRPAGSPAAHFTLCLHLRAGRLPLGMETGGRARRQVSVGWDGRT